MRKVITPLMQRVSDVLSSELVHLTAEEILDRLDDVGRATVFRALGRLCEEGIIRRLSLESGSSVYEYVRQPHMHFLCRNCGILYDIPGDPSELLGQMMCNSGHTVQKTDVTAYGVCKNCRMAANSFKGGNKNG